MVATMFHLSTAVLIPLLGFLMAWLLISAGGMAAWRFLERGGGATAIASLEATNRVLEHRVHELEEQDKSKTKRISELEARTDVALAIIPVLDALRTHEVGAAKRSDAMLGLLQLIAERLGPESDDG